jgi:pimeloyl-ACP methyl ester carboxylesterase
MSGRPIVLVHGAWGGAWIWRRVLALLRAAGQDVHAITLTGNGDRAHLRHRGIKLADHVADVLAAVQAEELRQIVLVGHSYGGMVITGAADRLLQRDPQAVGALVYVDAIVPLPGEGWGEQHSGEVIAARTAAAHANDHALPPPDPADFGIAGADREWLLRRQVPHPFGPYRDPLDFDAVRWAALPRTFIDCTQPAYPTIAAMRERVRRMPGFRVVEMATGHCPMVTEPAALVRLLRAASNPTPS